MHKLLVLTPQDSILIKDFNGLESIQNAIGGYLEMLPTFSFILDGKMMPIVLYCDEEYRLKHSGEKSIINAYATLLSGLPVYGNVVFINFEGEDEIGFTEEQATRICEKLNTLFTVNNKDQIINLHKKGDTVI